MHGGGLRIHSSPAFHTAPLVFCPFSPLAAASPFCVGVVLPWVRLWSPVFCFSRHAPFFSWIFLSKRPHHSSLFADVSWHPSPYLLYGQGHKFFYRGDSLPFGPSSVVWASRVLRDIAPLRAPGKMFPSHKQAWGQAPKWLRISGFLIDGWEGFC